MSIRTANTAKAKLIYNKNKDTYRIIVAFNVTERNKQGSLKFPTKPDFVSGDIIYEDLENDVNRIMENARQVLRTDNIQFV